MQFSIKELKFLPERVRVFEYGGGALGVSGEIHDEIETHAELVTYYIGMSSAFKDKFIPLDDANGRISDLIISYYNENAYPDNFDPTDPNATDEPEKKIDPKTENKRDLRANAYNKIYTDLLIKLSRNNSIYTESKRINIYSVALQDNSYEKLKSVNNAVETLAFFTSIYKDPIAIKDRGVSNSASYWFQDEIIPVWREQNEKITLYGKDVTDWSTEEAITKLFGRGKKKICGKLEKILPPGLVGGNILFIGSYILIGCGSLQLRDELFSEDEFKQILINLFGTDKEKIIFIGGVSNKWKFNYRPKKDSLFSFLHQQDATWLRAYMNYQPLYHLDFFITPVGPSTDGKRQRIIVGEAVMDLNRISCPKKCSCTKNDTGNTPIISCMQCLFEKTKTQLDLVAKDLANINDLEVYRMPLPLTWIDEVHKDNKIHRKWTFASYNNCIVQYISPNNKDNIVYLPRYSGNYNSEQAGYKDENDKSYLDEFGNPYIGGDWSELEKYEHEIAARWRRLGFNPIFLTNYLPMITSRGALRCMTKVIRRNLDLNKKPIV